MNEKLNAYIENLKKERVAVLGMGISNAALLRFLKDAGTKEVIAFDKNDTEALRAAAQDYQAQGLIQEAVLGEGYLDALAAGKFDRIFKSPVIRPDVPQLLQAVAQGAILTSEMEAFMSMCPCKMFAITGSDGKTTTTTLVSKLLEEHFTGSSDTKIWLGGNIGTPLIAEIGNIRETDRVVLELSSFQLMTLSVSPHVAVITNITPNHLDVHKDYQEYIDAKCRIYARRTDCRVVLNAGCPETLEIGMDLMDAGHRVDWFSAKLPTMSYPEGYGRMAYYMNDWIYVKGEGERFSLDRENMLLPGIHNVENLMAAVLACGEEISEDDVKQVAGTFGGVAHRLELVRKIHGVPYYNSSIDSSPNRTINALSVFKGNVVLIAGGKDKGIPYDALGPALVEKVKTLILVGATADKIEAALRACDPAGTVKIIHCESYPEAVQCAYEVAVPGDTVLLSPASTSFDRFKNFEERGNVFKNLVLQLPS